LPLWGPGCALEPIDQRSNDNKQDAPAQIGKGHAHNITPDHVQNNTKRLGEPEAGEENGKCLPADERDDVDTGQPRQAHSAKASREIGEISQREEMNNSQHAQVSFVD
jgi:hypothetical protein